MFGKIIKWICNKVRCNSSCSYNLENEIFNNQIMENTLSNYELTLKDFKKVYKILNKKEKSIMQVDNSVKQTNFSKSLNKSILI